MNDFKEIVKRTQQIVKVLDTKWLSGAWKNEKEISDVLALLSDQASRETYCREICWCFLNTFLKGQLAAQMAGMMSSEKWKSHVIDMLEKNIHPEIEAPAAAQGTLDYSKTATFILEQYRYGDKVKIDPGDICLDLGACLGDTAIWMLEQGAREVHAFEIEPENRKYMGKTIAKNPDYQKIIMVPDAVAAEDRSVFMLHNAYNAGAGRIVDKRPASGNYSEIKCVTIDSYCENLNLGPDFIKMDIEGAELDAINGAASVFEKFRPKFAICIYHRYEHRWEIPLRLSALCPEYDFFIKKSHPVFETVIYGCPKERLTG